MYVMNETDMPPTTIGGLKNNTVNVWKSKII